MRARAARFAAVAAAFAVAAPLCAQLPCSYSVTIIPNEPCFGGPANPVAINNLGHVVLTANCFEGLDESYIWTGGPMLTHIARPPNMLGFTATDINDNDVIAGTAVMTYAGQRGFMYDTHSGVWTELPPLNPPTGWSGANAINDQTQVAGFRSIGSRGDPVNPQTAFVWVNGTFTDVGLLDGQTTCLAGINAAGQACGWRGATASSSNARGLLANDAESTLLPPMPGGFTSALLAINNRGDACGHGLFPGPGGSTVAHAFIWFGQQMTDLGTLPHYLRSFALDIADDATVVGYCRTLTTGQDAMRGYVWRSGAMVDLESRVTPGTLSRVIYARSIAIDGRILAQAATGTNAVVSVVLQPVGLNGGDLNHDCHTNVDDLLMVILGWAQNNSPGDANHDGIVNVDDLLLVILNWSP